MRRASGAGGATDTLPTSCGNEETYPVACSADAGTTGEKDTTGAEVGCISVEISRSKPVTRASNFAVRPHRPGSLSGTRKSLVMSSSRSSAGVMVPLANLGVGIAVRLYGVQNPADGGEVLLAEDLIREHDLQRLLLEP